MFSLCDCQVHILSTAAIPINAEWENQTFVISQTSTSMVFEVCWMVVLDTSVLVNTTTEASLGNRVISLNYSVTASGKTQLNFSSIEA